MNKNTQTEIKPVDAATSVTPAVFASLSAPTPAPVKDLKITYDDFAKVEIRAGKILAAEKISNTDKLLKLSVDFAEVAPRQIISGISMYFPDPATLVGRTAMFVTNLEPRMIKGFESNGMLFAVSTNPAADAPAGSIGAVGAFSLLEPGPGIPPGTRAK